ncbi:hypothetical protein [Micromonospora sp. RP3T]|uniref:hypothetical protein n=1 Tax=Micromonospora sp. RP3T TaxID=2135446 RepID=UPI003D70A8C1
MNKLATTSTKYQSNATNDTEKPLIGALMIITVISIGALVYVVRISPDMGAVAPVVVPTIGTITVAAISSLTVVLRRRPHRSRR